MRGQAGRLGQSCWILSRLTMFPATVAESVPQTLADMLHRLGDIPPDRIRWQPYPGTATEADVVAALHSEPKRICELVDGVLVEKPMGYSESLIAGEIVTELNLYLRTNDLGLVSLPDGPVRPMVGLVRIPDVAFASWDRLDGSVPEKPVPDLVPELAVEVISEGNTPREIERKLREYFLSGVERVWLIFPKTQTAAVHSSPTRRRLIGKEQALEGGRLLPGFSLPLKVLFARALRRRPGGK